MLTTHEKRELVKKIENSDSKILIQIFNIIKKNNPIVSYTENNNGLWFNLKDLSDET